MPEFFKKFLESLSREEARELWDYLDCEDIFEAMDYLHDTHENKLQHDDCNICLTLEDQFNEEG